MLGSGVGAWSTRRSSFAWIFASPAGFAGGFCFELALLEAWSGWIQIALALIELAVSVAVMAIVAREDHRVAQIKRDILSEVREVAEAEGLGTESLFREDGERLMVYADKGGLIYQTFKQLVGGAIMVGGYLWARATILTGFWLIAIGLCIAFLMGIALIIMLLTLIRLAMRSPTLIINADGIVDKGSLIVTGRGLLRWNETLGVDDMTLDMRKVPLSQRAMATAINGALDIDLADFAAVRRRQPLWKRAISPFTGGSQPLGPRIRRVFLGQPAEQIVADINDYIKRHAPLDGWHARMLAEDDVQN
jgi:hypothetical protein